MLPERSLNAAPDRCSLQAKAAVEKCAAASAAAAAAASTARSEHDTAERARADAILVGGGTVRAVGGRKVDVAPRPRVLACVE